MQHQHTPKYSIGKYIEPTRVFIAILIAAVFWLAPVATEKIQEPTPSNILNTYSQKLIPAVPNVGAECAPSCQTSVCTDWDPTPCGSNDWDIGCCVAYGTECDPGCEEEQDPDPGDGGPTYVSPTINHTLLCSLHGNSGWCRGTQVLDLNASDQQNAALIISGDINGNTFTCESGQAHCPIELPEGTGTANYKVNASTGLWAIGTATFLRDATTPQVSGSVNGTSGTNGWYITPVTVTASASDTGSGLVGFVMSVDGTWVPYVPIQFNEGIHSIAYYAEDVAGNSTQTTPQEIKVDAVTPGLNVSLTGNQKPNGWYQTPVTITASSSDSGSGLAALELSVDGGAYQPYTAPFAIGDGVHTFQVRATDLAGNTALSGQTLRIDTITPSLTLTVTGTTGSNGWYRSNAQLTVEAADAGSGLAAVEVSMDGGAYQPYTSPIQIGDGQHEYQFRVTDNVGNVTQASRKVKVDTITPSLNLSIAGTKGSNGWYRSTVSVTPTAADLGSGLAALEVSVDGGAWSAYTIPLQFTDGQHAYQVRATDQAGNVTLSAQTLNVDTITPALTLTVTGSPGNNGWYRSSAQVTAAASDAGSKVAQFEVAVDGGAYQAYTAPIQVGDGQHNYQFRVTDQAGNVTQASQSVNVDTITPSLSLAVTGSRGENGWFVSETKVTPTASDAGSGVQQVEAKIGSGAWGILSVPLSFLDGAQTYQIRVTDKAGNETTTPLQPLYVDTIPPAIALTESLDLGDRFDYSVQDDGSQLTYLRLVIEDDAEKHPKVIWEEYPSGNKFKESFTWDGEFRDGSEANALGLYFITVKASDAAGNESVKAGVVHVGLFNSRADIPDFIPPNSTLPITTPTVVGGGQTDFGGAHNGEIGDGTSETVSAGGTESSASGDGAEGELTSAGGMENGEVGGGTSESASAGSEANGESGGETTLFEKAGEWVSSTAEAVTALFTAGNENTSTPFSNPGVLWGGAATALLGATLAEWQRLREEDEARRKAGGGGGGGGGEDEEVDDDWLERKTAQRLGKINPGLANTQAQQKALNNAIAAVTANELRTWERTNTLLVESTQAYQESDNKGQYLQQALQDIREQEKAYRDEQARIAALIVQVPEAEKTDDEKLAEYMQSESYLTRQISYAEYFAEKAQAEQAEAQRQALIAKNEDPSPLDMARVNQLVQNNVDAARWAGVASVAQAKQDAEKEAEKNKTWWDKAYSHQTELSIGTGLLAGLAAVAIIVTGVITAPAWVIVGGAVLATAAVITAGTLLLNNHFGLNLGNNLASNLIVGTVTTLIVAGVGLWLANLAPVIGTTIATTCSNYATACSQVMTIVDAGEEVFLTGQIGYYTWVGDQDSAAQATIELQLEKMDGGAPGNMVAAELGEQLAKLGDDVPELIATYGDDIIPLLLKYQDDAVDIIGAYGDEGIALLLKYGGDTPQAIKLVREYGTPAVKLLNIVDVESAGRVLKNPDAVNALLKWKPEDFEKFGVELVLRAENDAKALTALDKLTKLDINSSDLAVREEINRLIQEIAENSTQGSGERFVLGNWISHGDGYVADARVNGGIWYESHPDIYNKLEAVYGKGDPRIDDALWQINQAALQKQIEKGIDFDYSLTSKNLSDYKIEVEYIELLETGDVTEVLDKLKRDSLPARLKEIQLLLDAKYTPDYDNTAQVIHWTLKP